MDTNPHILPGLVWGSACYMLVEYCPSPPLLKWCLLIVGMEWCNFTSIMWWKSEIIAKKHVHFILQWIIIKFHLDWMTLFLSLSLQSSKLFCRKLALILCEWMSLHTSAIASDPNYHPENFKLYINLMAIGLCMFLPHPDTGN